MNKSYFCLCAEVGLQIMAFDDTKSPGDLISSTEFNNFVDAFLNHSSRHSSSGSDTINVTDLGGFVANEHVDHSSVSISGGTHLTGGGDLTTSRTLNVDETGIEADNLAGNNGASGQVLQTDGSNTFWTDLESETVKGVNSDYTTSGETTLLIDKLPNPYEVSSYSFDKTNSLSNNDSGTQDDLQIADSGTYVLVLDGNELYEYDLSTPYEFSSASFVTKKSNINGNGFDVVDGGSKVYVADTLNNQIVQYNLSTSYDVTTASQNGTFTPNASQVTDIKVKDDGSKALVFLQDGFARPDIIVHELEFGTDYDITSLSKVDDFTASDLTAPNKIDVNDTGDKMFLNGTDINFNDVIIGYDLGSSYDLTSVNKDTSLIIQKSGGGYIEFADGGNKLFIEGEPSVSNNDDVLTYIPDGVGTLTLSSSDTSSGKIVRVKDTTGKAGSNSVTINTESSETIDGSNSISLNTNYGVKQLQSDGTNWFVISDG